MAPLMLIVGMDPFLAALNGNETAAILAFVFGSAALLLILLPMVLHNVLRIGTARVVGELWCCGLVLHRRELPRDAIVRINDSASFPSGVVLEGRQGRIRLPLLSRKATSWLAAYLLHAVPARHEAE
jgi:hypothetical protein